MESWLTNHGEQTLKISLNVEWHHCTNLASTFQTVRCTFPFEYHIGLNKSSIHCSIGKTRPTRLRTRMWHWTSGILACRRSHSSLLFVVIVLAIEELSKVVDLFNNHYFLDYCYICIIFRTRSIWAFKRAFFWCRVMK